MNNKKESFFWTSYSDLMTSLFFIMLVLFVLVIALLHSRLKATQEELEAIEKINKSIEQIDTNYFDYNKDFKRHTLKNVSVNFKVGSFDMNDISYTDRWQLKQAGNAIKSFMDTAKRKNPGAEYLLIIEGQSSKDNWYNDGYRNNDVLSYQRALALYDYWQKDCNISFANLPCEVIVSGSGQRSKFRDRPDIKPRNQRFVIHIIPKPY